MELQTILEGYKKVDSQALIKKEAGEIVIPQDTKELIDKYYLSRKLFETAEEDFKKALLQAMLDNKMEKISTEVCNASVIKYKDNIEVDVDKFRELADPETFEEYSSTETSYSVDMEKLKRCFPEAFKECVIVKEEVNVDGEKLLVGNPKIAVKCVKITPSSRKPCIKFTEFKGEKVVKKTKVEVEDW